MVLKRVLPMTMPWDKSHVITQEGGHKRGFDTLKSKETNVFDRI